GESPLAAVEASAGGAAWVSVVRQLIAAGARLGVDELFFELMNQTRYLDLASFETEADRRQAAANLGRFAELLASYCEARRDHSLRGFMAYLDLVLISETDEEVAGSEDVGAARFQDRQAAAVRAALLPSLTAGGGPGAGSAASSEEPLQLSFSGISTYRECPRQYRFRYVYRLPRAADPEAEFGTILHLALRQ